MLFITFTALFITTIVITLTINLLLKRSPRKVLRIITNVSCAFFLACLIVGAIFVFRIYKKQKEGCSKGKSKQTLQIIENINAPTLKKDSP